jgi:hypothetical protein
MSYQEKRSLASIFSLLLSTSLYGTYILQRYQAGGAEGPNALSFWAAAILILVPVQIVSVIIVQIVFAILDAIATREEAPMIEDELDRLIDLKSTRNSSYVFGVGFLLSMGVVVIGMPPMAMFIMLAGSMIVAELIWELSHLYFYRVGV